MIELLKLTLILTIILLTPMVCRRIHVPSLVGFILVGVALGPHALGLIQAGESIQILGKMGLLYILFQSGVEMDLNDFQQHRRSALIFGIYTFIIPFALGILTSLALGFSLITSILLGAMYGSHTLMTYPIVSRYGVQNSAAVNIAVGGTMLAITLSLIALAIVESVVGNEVNTRWFTYAKILLFIATSTYAMPYIAQRFFKRWQNPAEGFVFVMLLLVLSALLAEWAGLDAILGAFVCGVALNRLIPNLSPLMRRINFVGSTIFVPIFLLGIGTMIDIRILASGWHIYAVALTMILTKLAGKWLAAFSAEKSFHLSRKERQLIFGMSHATSAGTLAVVSIGYELAIFNDEILNGAVIMILVLCTISGFITEYAARDLALREEAHLKSERVRDNWLMLSVGENLYPQIRELSTLSQLTETNIQQCQDWTQATRLIERTPTSVAVYHETQPLGTISRLLVAVPRYAEKEHDFISCFGQIRRLSSQIGAHVCFYACRETEDVIRKLAKREGKYLPATYHELGDWEDVLMIAKEMRENDLLVMVSARKATASYNPLFDQIPGMLERFFRQYSYMILYPEQSVDNDSINYIQKV